MSFTISGFGAQQYQASPQIFQALSLGGATPAPPQQPFGSPNQSLVPISRTAAAPALNLTLQAASVAASIDAINHPVAVANPALAGASPLSTAFAGARNTNVLLASGPPDSLDGLYGGVPPQGIVAFNVRPPVFNGSALLQSQTQTPPHTAQTPAPANPSAIAKIVTTVKNLAVAAVYPQPIFSFSA